MKFLITTSPIASTQSPNRDILSTAKEWIREKKSSGVIEVVYSTIPRGGIFIIDADDPKELWDLLLKYPLYQFLNIKVTPLVDFRHVFDRTIEFIDNSHSH